MFIVHYIIVLIIYHDFASLNEAAVPPRQALDLPSVDICLRLAQGLEEASKKGVTLVALGLGVSQC